MNRHISFRAIAAFLVILNLVLLVAVPAWAVEAGGAVVRPEPLALDIAPGQVATVDILLEDASDVYGIDVRAHFDPAVIEIIDADAGKDGIQMKPGGFPKPEFLVRNTADNGAGTLNYVTTQISPTLPATGAGVVFSVQLRAKAAGETSLTLDSVEMANGKGQMLPVTVKSGTIRVIAPGSDSGPDCKRLCIVAGARRRDAHCGARPGGCVHCGAGSHEPATTPPVLPGGLTCAGGALLPARRAVGPGRVGRTSSRPGIGIMAPHPGVRR